jgi:2-(1,2-epoxy-1,2-dihydrophenyl)acetyl-CoA isomerase
MSDLLVERRDRVLLATLNRPDSLNAVTVDLTRNLRETIESASADPNIRVVVLTGAGRGFCSGGDIAFMKSVIAAGGDFETFRPLVTGGRDLILAIVACDRPVIAAVNGVAAGGGMGLALSCDLRWASEGARFAQSFARIGLHPDWGSLFALPRLAGLARAKELMWTGDVIDAAEAYRLGLVNRVLPADSLLTETLAFADRLAHGASAAIAEIKRSLRAAVQEEVRRTLDQEIEAQERCWNTRDAREGIAAFLEKREAKFEGR